jgi:predicted nicotinamide N-methyase
VAEARENRLSNTQGRKHEPKRFIRDHLRLAPVPSLPGISLYTAHAGSGLGRLSPAGEDGPAPYWAWQWAGGLALARFVLDHPETVAGRRVLDFGAGSGLVGIAAARAGARAVICAEIDGNAVAAIELNAGANAVAVTAIHGDLTGGPPPDVDIVLAGDVFYDGAVGRGVLPFLDRCLAAGVDVLIGDPGRAPLPLARLRKIAEYSVPDFGDTGDAPVKPSTVHALEPK